MITDSSIFFPCTEEDNYTNVDFQRWLYRAACERGAYPTQLLNWFKYGMPDPSDFESPVYVTPIYELPEEPDPDKIYWVDSICLPTNLLAQEYYCELLQWTEAGGWTTVEVIVGSLITEPVGYFIEGTTVPLIPRTIYTSYSGTFAGYYINTYMDTGYGWSGSGQLVPFQIIGNPVTALQNTLIYHYRRFIKPEYDATTDPQRSPDTWTFNTFFPYITQDENNKTEIEVSIIHALGFSIPSGSYYSGDALLPKTLPYMRSPVKVLLLDDPPKRYSLWVGGRC